MQSPRRPARFLTARWRYLVMLNYEIERAELEAYVPAGTELDLFEGKHLVSMVGFLFDQTKIFGRVPIPLHASFEEVNLRFYVRRREGDEIRRGVVFIKELVPSRSVTWVARNLFGENYHRVPMRHRIVWNDQAAPHAGGEFCYEWQSAGRWSKLFATTEGELTSLSPDSMAEFITEHYWGYSRQRDGSTLEYAVEHPSWKVWTVQSCGLETDVESMYGPRFVDTLSATPHSALVAEGSPVAVYRGVPLT